jgi:hypothetical protein
VAAQLRCSAQQGPYPQPDSKLIPQTSKHALSHSKVETKALSHIEPLDAHSILTRLPASVGIFLGNSDGVLNMMLRCSSSLTSTRLNGSPFAVTNQCSPLRALLSSSTSLLIPFAASSSYRNDDRHAIHQGASALAAQPSSYSTSKGWPCSRIFVVLSTFLPVLEGVPAANPLTTWNRKLEPVLR